MTPTEYVLSDESYGNFLTWYVSNYFHLIETYTEKKDEDSTRTEFDPRAYLKGMPSI